MSSRMDADKYSSKSSTWVYVDGILKERPSLGENHSAEDTRIVSCVTAQYILKFINYLWIMLPQSRQERGVRGHPFMMFTRKCGFDPSSCPHASTGAWPPCGRPHAVDMKHTR